MCGGADAEYARGDEALGAGQPLNHSRLFQDHFIVKWTLGEVPPYRAMPIDCKDPLTPVD